MTMSAMRADDVVIVAKRCANACRYGFFSNVQMDKSGQLALGKQLADPFFESSDSQDPRVDVENLRWRDLFFVHFLVRTNLQSPGLAEDQATIAAAVKANVLVAATI